MESQFERERENDLLLLVSRGGNLLLPKGFAIMDKDGDDKKERARHDDGSLWLPVVV